MKTTLLASFVLIVSAAGCGRDAAPPEPAAAVLKPGLSAWTLPVAPGSAQPDLVAAPDGRLLLGWFDSQPGRRTRLQFADYDAGGQWGVTRTIAIGSSFFVDWADTPHLMATPDGALWVQWLQKSGSSDHAYDVVVSTSRNGGMDWSAPVRPYDDATPAEHGFVSLWPVGRDRLGIAWLDGRHAHHHESIDSAGQTMAGGTTMLRVASFDGALQRSGDTELDAVTCDCCQTDAAPTSKGLLLVYRDRTADDIRDIRAVRHDGKAWSASAPVSEDGWRMPACPVNGPSVAAEGDNVVVGWYTAAGDAPMTKLARSADAGDTFAAPVVLDRDEAVQGRIEVALDARNAWALWVREDKVGQSLWLARFAPDLSKEAERIEVAKLRGRGRGTGFPQLALRDGAAYVVWTDVVDKAPVLRGAQYRPR